MANHSLKIMVDDGRHGGEPTKKIGIYSQFSYGICVSMTGNATVFFSLNWRCAY